MAKAKFLCTSKTGIETFTVTLEASTLDVCPSCGKVTSLEFCSGEDHAAEHPIMAVPNGDRSFFKDIPHGTVFLSVLTPEAAAEFEVGEETIIEFTKVQKSPA